MIKISKSEKRRFNAELTELSIQSFKDYFYYTDACIKEAELYSPFANSTMNGNIQDQIIRITLHQSFKYNRRVAILNEIKKIYDENEKLCQIIPDWSSIFLTEILSSGSGEEQSENMNLIMQLQNRIAEFTLTDTHTGLMHRSQIKKIMELELYRFINHQIQSTIVMIDIFNLRKVNENYGLLQCQRIIATVGDIIVEQINKIDYAFRYGGDEFLIVRPHTSIDDCYDQIIGLNDILMRAIRKQYEIEISFSIGMTNFDSEDDDIVKVIDRADYACYESSQRNGNCPIAKLK